MRRAVRYLPALLLCLSAAAVTLWVRSYCAYDCFDRQWWSSNDTAADHGRTLILSGRGTVFFSRSSERVQLHEPPHATPPTSSVAEWTKAPEWSLRAQRHALLEKAPPWASGLARLGLAYRQSDGQVPNRGDWPRGPITSAYRVASVPYWLPVAIFAAWPMTRFARRATNAWVGRRRRRAGRCADCGYDLRVSTGRCPECGTAGDKGSDEVPPTRGAAGRGRAMLAGSFLAACAVTCLLNLRAAASRQPPSLADERRLLDKMVSAEVRRSTAKIRHPGTSRDTRRSLYRDVASFGTPEAVNFLAETYDEYKRLGRLGDLGRDGPDLVIMLWRIPGAQSADLLLRMLRDGSGDYRLIEFSAAVAGEQSVPHLRRLLDELPNDTVHYGAWRALLRFKEPRAVRDYLAKLRPAGNTPGEIQHLYDLVDWARAVHLTEVIPSLEALARHYEVNGPPRLRGQIVHTLLCLGHWAVVPDAIEMIADEVASNGSAARSSDGTAYVLRVATGQDFGTDFGRWRLWWDQQGRHQGGRPSAAKQDPPSETIEAVERAFLLWAMTPAGGVVPGPVVYVQGEKGRRPSTETIRYYTEAELRLLDVPRIRIDALTVEGDVARVKFYGPSNDCGPGPTVELTRDLRGWTVKGYVDVPNLLDDGGRGVF